MSHMPNISWEGGNYANQELSVSYCDSISRSTWNNKAKNIPTIQGSIRPLISLLRKRKANHYLLRKVLNWYLIPHISSRETTIMANMYRITNCPAGCISPLRSWSFFGDFYFDLKRSLIDGSPSRREAGRTGSNHLPVKIVNTGGSSSTELGTGPLQSWVMHLTGRYHIVWNLHDISSVGEEAECQPQGITSHSIASWPGCNDAKLCTDLFGIKFSSSLLVFSLRFDVLLYNDVTWQWSARSTATSRFWFLGHSTHNNNRILFRTSSYPDTRPIFDQT